MSFVDTIEMNLSRNYASKTKKCMKYEVVRKLSCCSIRVASVSRTSHLRPCSRQASHMNTIKDLKN